MVTTRNTARGAHNAQASSSSGRQRSASPAIAASRPTEEQYRQRSTSVDDDPGKWYDVKLKDALNQARPRGDVLVDVIENFLNGKNGGPTATDLLEFNPNEEALARATKKVVEHICADWDEFITGEILDKWRPVRDEGLHIATSTRSVLRITLLAAMRDSKAETLSVD